MWNDIWEKCYQHGVSSEQLDTGVKVYVRWGREKHSKLRSSTSKVLARGNMVQSGPSKRISMVMRLKRCVRPDHVGPYRLYTDLSLYPRTTGSSQYVVSKACYMIRFGFQKDLLWLLCREWTGWEKWSHM